MKHWRLKRLIPAGEKPGTGEWEVSPWWSSFFPFAYKSRSFYFPHQRRELPITPYRTRQNGKMVVSPSLRAEYWNGWLVDLWNILRNTTNKAKAKIKALRENPEEIPF